MAVGSDITHLQKQLASWVRIPITAPSFVVGREAE